MPEAVRDAAAALAQHRDAAAAGVHRRAPREGLTPVSTGSQPSYDAIVVGAGPNGLVAANHLADAGWSVLVLEAQPEVGGAVRSARDVHPDFVHDTFSAFYPLAAASPYDPRLRARGARADLAARAGGARPPDAGRRAGPCCTATARSPPR